jgi:hypothetical protein
MKTQRKILFVGMLLILSIITPLSVLGKKNEPRTVQNIFDKDTPNIQTLPNGNLVIEGVSEQTWTGGGWEGTVVQNYKVIVRTGDHGTMLVTGQGKGVFTGSVDGKVGTITYRLSQVMLGDDPLDWKGTTTILKGTGDLAGIKGQGVLIFVTQSTEWYIHFEP